jgi:hypothetical protein
MKKELIGIFLCMLFLTSYITVSGIKVDEVTINKEELVYEFVIIRAKINDLKEEIVNDEIYYTFHADYFKGFLIAFFTPFRFEFERLNWNDIDSLFPKDKFNGIINDNIIIGILSGPCPD